ncbi:MAG TPA: putative lipid II flippase FtsW [Patescibacteria group bacterium]|nr:putative lipid II flippase FtsW [Patescibacteria group bacterium]
MLTTTEKLQKYRPKSDYWILLTVVALSLFGLVMIGSASALIAYERFSGEHNYFYVGRQALNLLIGTAAMIFVANVDYHWWRDKARVMLVLTFALLLAVFIPGIGESLKGASRWIHLGPLFFQPSELVKLTFILYLAGWFEKRVANISFLPFALVLAAIIGLVIAQPDLGTLTVIVAIAAVMFYIAGGSYAQMGVGGLIAGFVFLLLIRLSPYRWQRLMVFLNPTSETQGASYHINQALLAIGSGGLWGLGFGRSVQKYLYLPEPYTDSIFAIIAEELGFFRASLIILAFLFLAWRGLKVAKEAPDIYGRLVAAGITTWIFIQAFINIGALSGLLPLTGVPLPFVSYGGSSLIVIFIAVGILLNISKHAQNSSRT